VSGQNVDGGVQSRKGRLSGNLGESAVIGNEIDHFLLHVLSVFFHAVGSLSERRGGEHVVADLGGVLIVLEGNSPIVGKLVAGNLVGDIDNGKSDRGHSQSSGSGHEGGGALHKVAAGGGGRLLNTYTNK